MIKTKFPISRMRRLRYTPLIRSLVKETQLSINDLIYPIFVKEGI
ncbi:MAG TPA: porphobilinogen synthase, partial [archaeon]|nr:porphobilinogen synthase [archaeon]